MLGYEMEGNNIVDNCKLIHKCLSNIKFQADAGSVRTRNAAPCRAANLDR